MSFSTSEQPSGQPELPFVGSDRTLSATLIAELTEVCDRAEDAGGTVPVVIRVGGGTPALPVPWPGTSHIHLVNKWEGALRRLERLGTAVIAVAGGHCTGPALETLLACDYRIGTPGTTIAVHHESAVPWPGMALHRLVNQVGVVGARALVLFGGVLDADEARAAGILDEAAEDTAAAVAAAKRSASGLAGSELALRRRLLLDAAGTSFEDALGAHLAACDRTMRRTAR
ncbi:enoyl-CoA-hydratase DpgB [Streptomyces sp. NPDC003691]